MAIIDQQTHQFSDGDRWVGVVQLNGPIVRKVFDAQAAMVEAAQHVLKRAAHKEMLLFQSQTTPFMGAIVGIEHFREGFTPHFFFDGTGVIADVEGIKIEAFCGISAPQTQAIANVHAVAKHRHVVGYANGMFSRNPAGAVVAFVIEVALGAASKTHEARFIRLRQFPRPTSFEPFIGDLHLPAVANQLVKNSKLVANAVSRRWNLQTCQ